MKKYTKTKAKEIIKEGTFVWLYLHGKFYDTELDGIFHLKVNMFDGHYISFETIWEELTIGFDTYGKAWDILVEYPKDFEEE